MDERQEFPREIFTKLGEMGLMGVVWPPSTAAPA
jgi:alkylation response protein AidB-like acyl-CoA dehydrogenase